MAASSKSVDPLLNQPILVVLSRIAGGTADFSDPNCDDETRIKSLQTKINANTSIAGSGQRTNSRILLPCCPDERKAVQHSLGGWINARRSGVGCKPEALGRAITLAACFATAGNDAIIAEQGDLLASSSDAWDFFAETGETARLVSLKHQLRAIRARNAHDTLDWNQVAKASDPSTFVLQHAPSDGWRLPTAPRVYLAFGSMQQSVKSEGRLQKHEKDHRAERSAWLQLAQACGAALAHSGAMILCNGTHRALGRFVCAGFIDALSDEETRHNRIWTIQEADTVVSGARVPITAPTYGRHTRIDGTAYPRRDLVTPLARVLVVMGGAHGAAQCIQIAHSRGIPIVPIPHAGGEAKVEFERLKREQGHRGYAAGINDILCAALSGLSSGNESVVSSTVARACTQLCARPATATAIALSGPLGRAQKLPARRDDPSG